MSISGTPAGYYQLEFRWLTQQGAESTLVY